MQVGPTGSHIRRARHDLNGVRYLTKWRTPLLMEPPMPFEPEERDRLIALAQNYAEAAAGEIRLTIEDTGSGVLVRGLWLDANGREQVETLSLSWELVERSGAPEQFLKTQVWAVEHGLAPAGSVRRERP